MLGLRSLSYRAKNLSLLASQQQAARIRSLKVPPPPHHGHNIHKGHPVQVQTGDAVYDQGMMLKFHYKPIHVRANKDDPNRVVIDLSDLGYIEVKPPETPAD